MSSTLIAFARQIVIFVGDDFRHFEVFAEIAHFIDRQVDGQPGHDASELFGQVLADGRRWEQSWKSIN